MTEITVHRCECEICQQAGKDAEKERHHRMNLFFSRLNEQQQRWYAALEAERLGHGGQQLISRITGLSNPTIQRGRAELDQELADRPHERVRVAGGGRHVVEKKSRN